MQRVAMRHLVGVAYTSDEAKNLAQELTVIDADPDDQGNEKTRPASLADYFPAPFRNQKEARFANGGVLPPDLSLIVKAREHGEDYVYSLLTGYVEPPSGMELRQGLYYNAYFPGGAIGMGPPLMDGQLDFDDGTPASVSQMAKDVATFLAYTAQKEQDERKKMGMKVCIGLTAMIVIIYYHKMFRWSLLKSRRINFEE
jgi:ubiquinol-cytochrome c reductase cytochrome c1 subunit